MDVIQESPSNNTETYFGVFCEEGQLPEAVKHLPVAKQKTHLQVPDSTGRQRKFIEDRKASS
jgi:hypothetical protein